MDYKVSKSFFTHISIISHISYISYIRQQGYMVRALEKKALELI